MIEEAEDKKIKGVTQKGEKVRFQLILSDELGHLYDEETKKLNVEILADTIKNIRVYEKQLDNPLPWYKKVVATVAFIKQKHVFVVFELMNSGLMGSVDFYDDHRIVLRLGN